jgi:hypothetical protein
MGIFTKDTEKVVAELTEAAREGFVRGDIVHLCSFQGPSKIAARTSDDASQILSAIAAEGWEPVSCSFMFVQHGGAVGHYLFKRKS